MSSGSVWRLLLRVGAGIFFGIAATLVVVVIPPVLAATSPLAARGFLVGMIVIAILQALLGATQLVAIRRGSKALFGTVGVLGLVLCLVCLDGAAHYSSERHDVAVAAVGLFVCVGGDLLAGVLALAAAFRTK